VTIYEKIFYGSSGKVHVKDPSKTRTQIGHTDADTRKNANIVPNYRKPLPGDLPCVSKMRMSPPGNNIDISEWEGKDVLKKYELHDFVPGKEKSINSKSPIKIGYDLKRQTFYLRN